MVSCTVKCGTCRTKVDANVEMYLKPTCDIYGVEIIALTPGVPILM